MLTTASTLQPHPSFRTRAHTVKEELACLCHSVPSALLSCDLFIFVVVLNSAVEARVSHEELPPNSTSSEGLMAPPEWRTRAEVKALTMM